ncbi:MAG TPA: beta-eliminating lyase-related protein [Candidatus Thermoplasmatota archaeon]|nr:beta-eliminating lyase-related protein [Candidatus Thermoplasmatota archaeon]
MAVFTGFGSDNHSGVHPKILEALEKANSGYTVAYGLDEYTASAVKRFKEVFGENAETYFVYNGTAANILGLRSVTDSFHSIFCAESAHLTVHECCGPERFIGCKLVNIPTPDGKLTTDLITPYLAGIGDPHMAQPHVISITQSSEKGTTYRPGEIRKLAEFAHRNRMLLHMDGARLCNAAAFLNTGLDEISSRVGVDVLSFGGTKNGMMFGDAVVFFNKTFAENFEFFRKQGMNLASKMRYIAAQFSEYLAGDLWRRNAQHANAMAQLLSQELKGIPELEIAQKVEANAVFVRFPKKDVPALHKRYDFHILDERTYEARLMCSFSTRKEDVREFARFIRTTIHGK